MSKEKGAKIRSKRFILL